MPQIEPWTVMCVLRVMPTKLLEVDGDVIFYDPDADGSYDGGGKPLDALAWIDAHRKGIPLASHRVNSKHGSIALSISKPLRRRTSKW